MPMFNLTSKDILEWFSLLILSIATSFVAISFLLASVILFMLNRIILGILCLFPAILGIWLFIWGYKTYLRRGLYGK